MKRSRSRPRPRPLAVRLYWRAARWLLPRELVVRHGDEMARTFAALYERARREGRRLELIAREARGLLKNALAERKPFLERRRRMLPMLERTRAPLRLALRSLRGRPGLSGVIIATLAPAIAAITATFAVIDAVLMKPLPYETPSRLVVVWNRWGEDGGKHALSVPELWDYRERTKAFDEVAIYRPDEANLTGSGPPARVAVGSVSTNFFDTLGVSATLGRTFLEEDDESAVILSHGFWTRHFGARDDAGGESIRLDGAERTIIGVLPRDFVAPFEHTAERRSELFVAFAPDPAEDWNRGDHSWIALGRLAEGETAGSASAELDAVTRALTEEGAYKESMRFGAFATPLMDELTGGARTPLFVLLAGVGLLLLIAATNVASLLLARAQSRTREVALHAALGASRFPVALRITLECGLLVVVAGAAGLFLSGLGLRAFASLAPPSLPRASGAGLDARVIGMTLVVTAVCAVLASLPATLSVSRVPVVSSLQAGARGLLGKGATFFLRALASVQIALTAALLVAAMLLLRTFHEASSTHPGFERENRLSLRLSLPENDYPDTRSVVAFYERLVTEAANLPGVEAAGAVRHLPLDRRAGTWSFDIEDRPTDADAVRHSAHWQVATPGLMETLGIPLFEGRTFDEHDRFDAPLVAVVSRSLGNRHWPGESAVGKRIRIAREPAPWIDVVGVVGDVRHNELLGEPLPQFYIPHAQWPRSRGFAFSGMTLVVHSSLSPGPLTESLEAAVGSIDPNLPIAHVSSLEAVFDRSIARPRFTALLIGTFAGLALGIAAVGIYSVLAYTVAERIPEIGLRMALGADRRALMRLVLREGLTIAGIGASAGMILAGLAGESLRALLYGVTEHDAASFALVWIGSLLVGAVAAVVPARKASRTSPVRALGSL